MLPGFGSEEIKSNRQPRSLRVHLRSHSWLSAGNLTTVSILRWICVPPPRGLAPICLRMPASRPRSDSPIWARSTSASRGQEVPAPGRRRSVSAPRHPTAGAAARRFALNLGRPLPLPSRARARSAPARARPDAAGTLRARLKHAQEQQHAALEARSREQAAELCRLRRSLKALMS